MKISKSVLRKCVSKLMEVKASKLEKECQKTIEEINCFALKELERQSPEIFKTYNLIREKNQEGIFHTTKRCVEGFYILEFYIDYSTIKDFCETKRNFLDSLRLENYELKTKIEAILIASKKEDILQEFPELKEILQENNNVCTSLACIKSIKDELK